MTAGSLLSAVGRTPLIRMSHLYDERPDVQVLAKLELLNPGGSAKDRPALRMLREAWDAGRIGPGSVIVESSSGNTAISLAMACAQLKLRLIVVVDPRTAKANLDVLAAFGAEIDTVTEPDLATGEFLPARLHRVSTLLADVPGSFWPNQYENENNYRSQAEMMAEIAEAAGRVDWVVGAVSTCGTLLGCSVYVRDQGLGTRIVAVDAENSAIFTGRAGGGIRRFPGLGAGIVPPFGRTPFWDEAVTVSDWEMVESCRRLARREGLLAGPSSGGVVAALGRLLPRLPSGAVCAIILHDRGERYLDTVYSDAWVHGQFGRTPQRQQRDSDEEGDGCVT